MPLGAFSMLKANQTQTPNGTALNTSRMMGLPNGTALNASQMMGLPGLGNNLQDDLAEQLKQRQKLRGFGNAADYGIGNLQAAYSNGGRAGPGSLRAAFGPAASAIFGTAR